MGRLRLPHYVREDIHSYLVSVTEMRRRRVHNRATSQRPDPSWLRSMRQRLRSSRPTTRPPAVEPRTIFRVPASIRHGHHRAYEPKVVSIGPLHKERPLQLTDEHKWLCVRWLLSRYAGRRRADRQFARCVAEMVSLEAAARCCYPEGEDSVASATPHQLAEMMLLDGCFILYVLMKQLDEEEAFIIAANDNGHSHDEQLDEERAFIIAVDDDDDVLQRSEMETNHHMSEEAEEEGEDDSGEEIVENNEEEVRIEGNVWIWTLVKYDLLMLENQIPFFVVEALFSCLVPAQFNLVAIALRLFVDIHPQTARNPIEIPSHQAHHLLHLFHLSLLPASLATSLPSAGNLPAAMLPEWIPSATELQETGVRFKKKIDSNSFLEVKFTKGVMEIPRLHIYKYSDSVFRNLIAFEQCFPVQPYITIYAVFMHCMVRSASDVRLLHLNGILLNGQSTDTEAALLFNRLCEQVHYANDTNYLRDLFIEVRTYHESRWHNWLAELVRNYFGSPWVSLSVMAAIVVLVLTVVQAFFAMFAYFKPPN